MKEFVTKQFDDFTFTAHLLPALTVTSPFFLLALYRGIIADNLPEAGLSALVGVIIMVFVSRTVREWGKTLENKMFEKLGGQPSTIILRFTDNHMGAMLKTQYHKWLNQNMNDLNLPLCVEEEKSDVLSDEKYARAATGLRVYANAHRDMLPRVYQELKKYNYWRNLYGCKSKVVYVYLFLAAREFVLINEFSIREMILFPFPKYLPFWGMAIWTICFCSFVTQRTVERNAFDYAKALIETIDNRSNK